VAPGRTARSEGRQATVEPSPAGRLPLDSRPLARLWASVRLRAAVAAMVIVGAGLSLGAVGMFVLLHRSLYGSLEASTKLQADEVAGLLSSGDGRLHLPSSPSLVQVVAADGRVVAADPLAAGSPALLAPLPPGAPEEVAAVSSLPRARAGLGPHEGPYVLVRRAVRTRSGWVTVEVVTSLDTLREALARLARILGVGVPLAVLLVGGVAWLLAGRALRPVEMVRAEVAEITASDLHRRVPTPRGADEIARLAATMNSMLERLETAQRRQSRFVSDASHELRTPLAVLRTELEVAATHPGDEPTDVLRRALEQVDEMGALVEDLLLLARAQEGVGPGGDEIVDLDDVVLTECRQLRDRSGLRVDVSGVHPARVRGRRRELGRVVRNLCDNAGRWAASEVVVSLRREGRAVELVVEDDGPGIPPADRAAVFQRFVRLEESRTREVGGTGLGLAIVKELVSSHGGQVWVADGPRGARLVVRLPAAADD